MNRGLKKPPVHLWFILFIYGLWFMVYVVSHLQCVRHDLIYRQTADGLIPHLPAEGLT